MSLHPQEPSSAPEETCRIARAGFPKGTLCLHIADALGAIYKDEQFAACFLAVANPPKPRADSPWLPCCSTLKAYPIVKANIKRISHRRDTRDYYKRRSGIAHRTLTAVSIGLLLGNDLLRGRWLQLPRN
jgi:hypothetical protein